MFVSFLCFLYIYIYRSNSVWIFLLFFENGAFGGFCHFDVQELNCWFLYRLPFGVGGNTFPARTFPPDGATFSQVTQGIKATRTVPAFGYWNMQFYQVEAAYVKFQFGLPRRASLALYARRNSLPTHTQYDISNVLTGLKKRNTRASNVTNPLPVSIQLQRDVELTCSLAPLLSIQVLIGAVNYSLKPDCQLITLD